MTLKTTGASHDRRTLILVGIAIAAATISVLIVSSRLLRASRYANTGGNVLAKEERKQEELKEADAARKKAPLLRDKWRIWADKHTALLRQMQRAPPGDTAARDRVWEELPSNLLSPDTAGLTFSDLTGNGPAFTWQPGSKRTSDARERNFVQDRNKSALQKHHDIEIAFSAIPGPTMVVLWASGRITESTVISQNIPGKPSFLPGPEQEIYPPFEASR